MANRSIDKQLVGYYVHHRGTGHMQRALTICRQIARPVVMFSSHDEPQDLPTNVTYIHLISDVIEQYGQPAKGVFHYTPYDKVIFERNQQLINAWQHYGIRELYVDVSIEVAVLAKLYGLTVGHALMQGVRTDKAHTYGYDAVDYLLAHCAPEFDEPTNRTTATPILYSGGISRLRKRQPTPLVLSTMPHAVAITTSPKYQHDMSATIIQSAQQFPKTTWHIIGRTIDTELPNIVSHGIIKNPEQLYEHCEVIIGSGGTNTIMEAASLGKPFICIPEERAFGEQISSAKTLQRLNAAVYAVVFPKPNVWPELLNSLSNLDLQAFSNLVSDDAAATAARVIETAGQA